MSGEELQRSYEAWPTDPHERQDLAREIFGAHLVAAHDGWLSVAARMLFEGYRYKSPTDEEQRFLDWIASLKDEERQSAFAFVRSMLSGVVFSILNHFDGSAGSFLQVGVREQLRVVIDLYERGENTDSPRGRLVETLPINSPESQRYIDLHDLWDGWLERYSRWKSERRG